MRAACCSPGGKKVSHALEDVFVTSHKIWCRKHEALQNDCLGFAFSDTEVTPDQLFSLQMEDM